VVTTVAVVVKSPRMRRNSNWERAGWGAMSKVVEYSQSLWMGGAMVFMVLSVATAAVQKFWRDKDLFEDIPAFLLLPLMSVWLIAAFAGIATAMLAMLVPVVRWLAH
jgi:hypothetical protein